MDSGTGVSPTGMSNGMFTTRHRTNKTPLNPVNPWSAETLAVIVAGSDARLTLLG